MTTAATIRAYARHEANWILAWCSAHAVDPLAHITQCLARPSPARSLCTRFAHQTIRQYCAAIRRYHHAAGLEVSQVESVSARRVVQIFGAPPKSRRPPSCSDHIPCDACWMTVRSRWAGG